MLDTPPEESLHNELPRSCMSGDTAPQSGPPVCHATQGIPSPSNAGKRLPGCPHRKQPDSKASREAL